MTPRAHWIAELYYLDDRPSRILIFHDPISLHHALLRTPGFGGGWVSTVVVRQLTS